MSCDPRTKCCATCGAWEHDYRPYGEEEDMAQCHRHAPPHHNRKDLIGRDQDQALEMDDLMTWPVTDASEWCAEWIPREEQANG